MTLGAVTVIEPWFAFVVISSENEQLSEPGSCECVMSTTENPMLPVHSFVNDVILAVAASAFPNVAAEIRAIVKSETSSRRMLSHRKLRHPLNQRTAAVIDRERERVIARRQI